MQRLAIDTDIFSFIERSGHSDAVLKLGPLPLLVTQIVWDECVAGAPKSKRLPLLEGLVGTPTPVLAGGPVATTVASLLAQGDLEQGEVAVIAVAIHDPEVVPVLHDRHALFRAVEELNGRPVLSFHGFLGELRKNHRLSRHAANQISTIGTARRRRGRGELVQCAPNGGI